MTQSVYTVEFLWSRTVWIITSLYFLFAVTLISLLIYTMVIGGVVVGIIGLVIALPILLGILIYCEGYSPQRLELWSDRVVILRRYDSITIYRDDILSITALASKDLRGIYNIGGCGGLFGYFGSFTNRGLGQFSMYATEMRNLFLVRLKSGKKVVINCSEPKKIESFIAVSE